MSGVVVLRPAGLSLRFRRRSCVALGGLLVLVVALAVAGLATGDFPVPFGDVVAALLGSGEPGTEFVVRTLRAPRALLAILVGVALGVSGAIFQSLTDNPLGSPDVIGFTAGAATGGIVCILLFTAEPGPVALAAVGAGLVTAVAVYALAFRHGGVQPFRLVLVGLGMAYTVLSLNWYLITKASLTDAMTASRWLVGSLNDADWSVLRPLAVALVVLLPLVLLVARPLAAMEVGDDASLALGVPVQAARAGAAAIGVVLAAVSVAAAGPVSFIAFMAPQIARRLTRAAGPNLTASALSGAALLLGADLLAQLLPVVLPVGLVTGLVGGAYLAWLLLGRATGRRTT